MYRNATPVVAAEALLARGVDDLTVVACVQHIWNLDLIEAQAAVAAAATLAGRRPGIGVATPPAHRNRAQVPLRA